MLSSQDRQEIRKELDSLVLFDDFVFSYAFRNDRDAIQLILRCILGMEKGLEVEDVRIQESVKSLDSHSVRFDILARGTDGSLFDVEIQKTNKKDLRKRASFYMSVLTNSNLEAGEENYDELRDRYVIFICDWDVAKRGEPLYTFKYMMNDGTPLDDGGTIIFANASYRGDDDLTKLFEDLKQRDPSKMHYGALRKSLEKIRTDKETRIEMSTEFEEFVARKTKEISERVAAESMAKGMAEGMAKGMAKSRTEIAATLLKEKLLSPEEIERVTGIPIDQVSEAASKYGV